MILKMTTHSLEVLDVGKTVLLELVMGPDTAQHQDLRSVDGTSGQDDFLACVDIVGHRVTLGLDLNTDDPWFIISNGVHQKLCDMRMDCDGQVGTSHDSRVQVRSRKRRPLSLGVDKGWETSDTQRSVQGVNIMNLGKPDILACWHKPLVADIRQPRVASVPLTVASTVLQVQSGTRRVGLELLHATQVWPDVVVAPSRAPVDIHPFVKVGLGAVVVHHGIERRGATEHLPARPEQTARTQVALFLGVVVPVLLRVEVLGEHQRHLRLADLRVVAASLQQENRDVLVLRELAS